MGACYQEARPEFALSICVSLYPVPRHSEPQCNFGAISSISNTKPCKAPGVPVSFPVKWGDCLLVSLSGDGEDAGERKGLY